MGADGVVAAVDAQLLQLRLSEKFAEALAGREPRDLKLRDASGGEELWEVEVLFDGDGQMHLARGWEEFAGVHGLQPGHFLKFRLIGDEVLSFKEFDGMMCHGRYNIDIEDDA
ncbi:hypothetical protein ACQ4PT_010502 [Festuca glaucescens]